MRALVAVALIACGKSRDDTPAPPPSPPPLDMSPASHGDCVAASKGGLSSPGGTGLPEATNAELRANRSAIILELCAEDHWTVAAAQCHAKADGLMAVGKCLDITPNRAHVTERMQTQIRTDLAPYLRPVK